MIKFKIREMMDIKGVTATELMRSAEISYTMAHKFKNYDQSLQGKSNTSISFEVLDKLCIFFDCEVEDLLERVRE